MADGENTGGQRFPSQTIKETVRQAFGIPNLKNPFIKNDPPPPRTPKGTYPVYPKLGLFYGTPFNSASNKVIAGVIVYSLVAGTAIYWWMQGKMERFGTWLMNEKPSPEAFEREVERRQIRVRMLMNSFDEDFITNPKYDSEGNPESIRDIRLRLEAIAGVYSTGEIGTTRGVETGSM